MEREEKSSRKLKNVWLIQTGELLPFGENSVKMRTALLADKVAERGCDVTWWTSAFDHFSKKWISQSDKEIISESGIRFFTIKGLGYKKNISLARFMDYRIIARKFRKLAYKRPLPDIIIASMPPYDLAYEAVKFGRDNGIPVIIDIRDPWPALFMDRVPAGVKSVARFLLNRDFNMAKTAIRDAYAVTAATRILMDWGLSYAGRKETEKDRVFYIGHKRQERMDAACAGETIKRQNGTLSGKFVVVFAGMISGGYHDVFILLDAAERLAKNQDIHFVIAGDGELFSRLKTRADGLSNVTLTGWLDNSGLESLLRRSSVGISPTPKKADLVTNKFYSYVSAGLPVITSFAGEAAEFIERYKLGYYYEPGDVNVLVKYIEKLHDDEALYKDMCENSKKVFRDIFDADKIYKEYAGYIEEIYNAANKEKMPCGIKETGKSDLIKQLGALDKSTDQEWAAALEKRKREELLFHNSYRNNSRITGLSKGIYEKIYGNKKFYTITKSSSDYADRWIAEHSRGRIFLDYACGNGANAIKAAKAGAELAIGVDLSEISVKNARDFAGQEGLSKNTYFLCGDCESTGLPAGSIDIIVSSGVLHHLELKRAFAEMNRILKPGGRVFITEALDYNPIIKFYRYATPEMRTEWETKHVVSYKAINTARNLFEVSDIRHWHLFGIMGAYMPFALPFFNIMDSILLKIPFIKMMSWMVTFEMRKK